jgi:copper resistance protein B
MGAMDHSKMNMDQGQMDGMESMEQQYEYGGRHHQSNPIPVLTDADRAAAFPGGWSWCPRQETQLFHPAG